MSSLLLVDLTPGSGAHGVRGIGSYVRGLSEALAVAPAEARGSAALLVDTRQRAPDGYQTVRVWRGTRWRPQDVAWASRLLADTVTLARSGARALHMTDPRAPVRPPLARRLAVTAYDLIPLEPDVRAGVRAHRRGIFRLYLRTLRTADRVISISSTTAASISEALGIDRRRIDVVYPVVKMPDASTDLHPGPDPTFLFVGVPDSHKRPELAIAALAEFRARHNAGRLRIIGPAARVHVDRLRRLARSAGVEQFVSIEGSVPASALDDALRSATALLAVSRLEGFGLPPVEAVLRGVPVIAVDTPVARETLATAAHFVVADPTIIADAMEEPVAAALEARMALAARYSARAVAHSLWESYRRLLDD